MHDYVWQLRPGTDVLEHDINFIMECLGSLQVSIGAWITLPTIHADEDAFAREAFAKLNFRPHRSGCFGVVIRYGRLAAAHGVESVQ